MKYGNGEICYRRTELPTIHGGTRTEVRVTASRVDTEEVRGTIMALWSMLTWDHRLDMISELTEYANPGPDTYLSEVALAACQAQHGYSDQDICPKRPDQQPDGISYALGKRG